MTGKFYAFYVFYAWWFHFPDVNMYIHIDHCVQIDHSHVVMHSLMLCNLIDFTQDMHANFGCCQGNLNHAGAKWRSARGSGSLGLRWIVLNTVTVTVTEYLF